VGRRQLAKTEERHIYMNKRVLVGLIGADITGSLSPAVHEDAFAALGWVGHYHLMDVSLLKNRKLDELLAAARAAGFAGVNVTFPFKQAVMPLLDQLSPEAAQIGAVNTVVFDKDGRSHGHNTDRTGFRRAFAETYGEAARGQEILVLGCGGAGRAVAYALADLGVRRLMLCDRDGARAQALAADLGRTVGAGRCAIVTEPEAVAPSVAGIVNATPVGMKGHDGLPMSPEPIAAHQFVCDVIYTPLETAFLDAARRKGARVMGGAGMCVHQAAEAFALFTGHDADLARMRRTFVAAAERRDRSLLSP
jgi:shikimate dehydrogenase